MRSYNMAGGLGNSGGRLYSFGSQPVLIDCNFIVDTANGNGYGNRTLKGQGVEAVYMHSTASLTGTTTSGSNIISAISGGTSSLLPGMPVQGTGIPAGSTITSILSSGSVQISANATSNNSSESITYQAVGSPNPAAGYALIKLSNNYNRYLGGFTGFGSQTTGSTSVITAAGAALTVGTAYTIATVGVGGQGTATIAPVADSSGSLASTYFSLYDSYGNTFIIWFSVSGVGSQPNLGPAAAFGQRGLQYVQQSITTNETAANIGAALVTTIENLPSGVSGVFSFTATGTTTVTVVSTANAPIAGIPQDGNQTIAASNSQPIPIFFTISSGSATSGSVWTDGFGNLYTVSATISSQTLLKTTGVQSPGAAAGVLTFVSGTGATTALNYSAAVAGFTFALTANTDNNADWHAVGVPHGVTPAVGVAFVATSTGSGFSSGTVIASGVSGILAVEVIGNPNLSLAPHAAGPTPKTGGWILVQFLAPTSSSVTTPVATAPAHNSTCGMAFYVDAALSPSNINPRYP
jgi:hypothetical protein